MIHAAVEVCQEGDILVVANTAPSTHGMFGELLATSLMARGVRGLVIDAGVARHARPARDGLPGVEPARVVPGHGEGVAGSVNVPVVLGGAIVRAGDVICADDDGVVVVPRDDAAWAAGAVRRARIAKENCDARASCKPGELGLDLYGLRAKLAELGVRYVDEQRR